MQVAMPANQASSSTTVRDGVSVLVSVFVLLLMNLLFLLSLGFSLVSAMGGMYEVWGVEELGFMGGKSF